MLIYVLMQIFSRPYITSLFLTVGRVNENGKYLKYGPRNLNLGQTLDLSLFCLSLLLQCLLYRLLSGLMRNLN